MGRTIFVQNNLTSQEQPVRDTGVTEALSTWINFNPNMDK